MPVRGGKPRRRRSPDRRSRAADRLVARPLPDGRRPLRDRLGDRVSGTSLTAARLPEGPRAGLPERDREGQALPAVPRSAVFAWLVYVAYEVVLPVSIVDGFGYEPAAWGFLVWINLLLVTLFQLRLTLPPRPCRPRRSSSRCS